MTMARAFSPEEMELRDALNRHATNNPGNPGKNVSLSITMKGNNYMYKKKTLKANSLFFLKFRLLIKTVIILKKNKNIFMWN